jgi:lipid II:glycine glycyltransferase (peptidoglycan interpeptide bridge formation enzyme)
MYLPKGPLLRDWGDEKLRQLVLSDLIKLARRKGAIFLKMDPDIPLGSGIPGTPEGQENPLGAAILDELTARGFSYSDEQIQFRNTVLIDLSPSEDELLARMKQKTRYNIRLAARKGVIVREGNQSDLTLLYKMYAETSLRDGFTIRGQDYYQSVWQTFMAQDEPTCQPLIAEVDGDPVAAVMIFAFAKRAYYMHGMSRAVHRNKMPTYLLQWEAMKYAKAKGCTIYDLWGAPEVFDESDSMWGVFRFKRGLGGEVLRTIGAYDLPIRPYYYKLYTQVLPRILDLMRRRGKTQVKEAVEV